ncbi:MAG: hypothetical protein RDV41_13290 [Planctomycetota bacterium]|nr:hypothetical protein [Planctomycetota bacterium]
MLNKLMSIDRRIIFLLVAVAAAIPMFMAFKLPIVPSPSVLNVYDTVEKLPPGSPVLISFDFDPASEAELYPMSLAVLHHCFTKGHRVYVMALWPGAFGLIENAIKETAGAMGKKSGEDYVVFPYNPGYTSVIIGLGQDLLQTFPKDAYGRETASMPALAGVKSLRDMKYVVSIAAGSTVEAWIVYGREKSKFVFGAGCTGVMAPDCYPFLGTGQLNGLLAGLKGAADYEHLVGRPGRGIEGMRPQSVVHILVILLILLGNTAYLLSRRAKKPA